MLSTGASHCDLGMHVLSSPSRHNHLQPAELLHPQYTCRTVLPSFAIFLVYKLISVCRIFLSNSMTNRLWLIDINQSFVMIIITVSISRIFFAWPFFFWWKEWSKAFSEQVPSILVFVTQDTFLPVWTDAVSGWIFLFTSFALLVTIGSCCSRGCGRGCGCCSGC